MLSNFLEEEQREKLVNKINNVVIPENMSKKNLPKFIDIYKNSKFDYKMKSSITYLIFAYY